MDFQESLEFLYGLQKFGIKLGLDNIRALLDRLGRPDRKYGIIHVGGTNGKGSVSACLAKILQNAGYRTGLYTSPHLHSFTERIRIDGAAISESEVARLTADIHALSGDIPATFFEFTTALALRYFEQQQVDFVILEVGMGGRLDATNAVSPRVSVISTICLDHSAHLGATLHQVAGEKAGIIKPGVPVVIGRQPAEALPPLLDAAQARQAPLTLFGRDFSPQAICGGFSFEGLEDAFDELRPALVGRHQHDNLSLALAAALVLKGQGVALCREALRSGVEEVLWPGRLEWWQGGAEILLDGAHNQGGAEALGVYLHSLDVTGIRWVVGIKGDKETEAILGPVMPLVSSLYCCPLPVEESIGPEALVREAEAGGTPAAGYADVGEALAAALGDRQPGEIVLVAGSLFLVAAAREYLIEISD